jgi:mono/diheme cytochrome c family protein
MHHGRAHLGSLVAAGLLLLTAAAAAPPSQAPSDEFARTIKPLVDRHCISCHGAKGKPKADLDLTRFASEASLRDQRKIWKQAVRLLHSHEMPPVEAKPPLPQPDRERLAKAIDAVLNWVDPKAPLNPGRVTARRLNRTEYGNTIRDLLEVDFDPAEDFPSDDIGHGFDNIGDVLTLPPVLMERYLAAAEAVVQRAFPAEVPKPAENHTGAKYLEPAGNKVPQTPYRPLTAAKGDAIQTGPLFKSYRIAPDGEYVFRFRAFAGPKGAKVAVLACGKKIASPAGDAEVAKLSGAALQGLRPFRILETLDVKPGSQREARKFEVKIPPTPGVERLAVALLKGPEADPPQVSIESFVLTGPLDPRPAFQRRTLAQVQGKPRAEQTREILRIFASRAFRRPVSEAELGRLVKLVEQSEAGGAKWEAALGLALQAVLVSPKFLFRVELDDRPDAPDAHPISEHQLASRLSYFLWASLPDDELAQLAAQGRLTAGLEPQVRRMLKDPRARELVDSFAMQWLQLKRISFVAPDGGLFPQFNQRLRQSMLRETELFLEAVFREDRSVLDLLAADFTYLDERLGRHYGIVDTMGNRPGQKSPKPGGQPLRGEEFHRVSLQDRDRGGLLGQASVLTVTSNPTRTSPVKRGRWVLEQLLGEPPPPPPPDVPELPETPQAALTGSLKQRMEKHRADPKCANCHTRMDAIGFALENYNAIGAWRTKDGSFDIDAGGTFPDGTAFKGPAELRKVLLDRKDLFVRCFIEKLMIYALGRGIEPYDDPAIRRIQAAVAKDGYKISSIILEIARSEPFRLRRGKNSKD